MSDVDPRSLLEPAATRVRDPVSGRSVWLAGVVREPRLDGDTLVFDLVFTPKHTPDDRKRILAAIQENLKGLGYEGELGVQIKNDAPMPGPPKKDDDELPGLKASPGVQPHGGPVTKKSIPGVKHVVLVASGKGGVGKSTVATNLAVALQRLGHPTGLLDADVYGPSLPRMMNATTRPMVDQNNVIIPSTSYGVRCLSVGLLVPEEEAIVWRGPMVMNLIRQFLQQAHWGELDYLVVDLPPGTGDAQLTLIQGTDVDGAVVVTTPQPVALVDAIRGITMFRKLDVPVLGIVENMAWYELPDGTRDYVFGEGGGKRLADKQGTDLLGQLPLQTAVRKGGDQGLPPALDDDEVGRRFRAIAEAVVQKLPTTVSA